MSATELFDNAAGRGELLGGSEANVTLAPSSEAPHRAWLGTDGHGFPAAYFEVTDDDSTHFSVSRVINVRTVTVEDHLSREHIATLKVTCHDPRLNAVFHVFIDEVLAKLGEETSALEIIRTAASEWRSLLQVANSGLPESALVGLYGELRFLESLVEALGPSALETWQRTPQDVHDFITDRARVEVKTSAFQNRTEITVHGLRQLEPPTDATLTLAVAEVQRHGSETLDFVVDRILRLGVDRELFTHKLASIGYVQGMPGASEESFSLISWRYWEIDTRTPVLNKSAVSTATADSIGSLSYSLSLSALGDSLSDFDYLRLGERTGELM